MHPSTAVCACRVPLSKQERSQLKSARRGGMAGGALLDDFADEIGHLVQVRSAAFKCGQVAGRR